MRIMSVVGARPQFVKLAPVAAEFKLGQVEHLVVHTGQHYDALMSDVFFRDLGIPDPDYNLEIGSDLHGAQTGAMLAALEPVMMKHRPDWVLVYGDTNSTLAAALAAVKLDLSVAHLEAGLRSFNRRMPEEHNRVLTDHASDLLLAPTLSAVKHLENEGLGPRTVLVGDVMTDVLFMVRDRVEVSPPALPWEKVGGLVATIHRPENTDSAERLAAIIEALAKCGQEVHLLAHPRLRAAARTFGVELARGGIAVHDPLPYPQLVAAVMRSDGVVTDSGGLQKEAFLLRRLCTTLRRETEWIETVESGWNMLVGQDLNALPTAIDRPTPTTAVGEPYGDGRAARAVLHTLTSDPRMS